MVEVNPTNCKTSIAHRTRRSYYERMKDDLEYASRPYVSLKTFYRLLKTHFPDIRFVKVRARHFLKRRSYGLLILLHFMLCAYLIFDVSCVIFTKNISINFLFSFS